MLPSARHRSQLCAIVVLWFVVATVADGTALSERHASMRSKLQGHQRSLIAEATECYTAETAAASVNTTVQLQIEQQLARLDVQQSLISVMSQYLRVSDCSINLTSTSSTVCPATDADNSNSSCAEGQYICRGVIQVPQDMYTAVQDNLCTPDASHSTAICQGNEMDLTTYLSIQQGQCCLQCPGQQDCTAGTSEAPQNTSQPAAALYDCSSFTVTIAVGSSLEGSSLEDLMDTAITGSLLDLYLQASALPNASILSVGPTGTWNPLPPTAEASRMHSIQSHAELGSSSSQHMLQ